MAVKTERITILGTPDFKSFLSEEAKRESISISELVRRRCQQRPPNGNDERVFAELVAQLTSSVKLARRSLDQGIKDAETVIKELRHRQSPAARARRTKSR